MSIVAVKIKVMPESPETNLKELEEDVGEMLKNNDVKNPSFEIEPIAFGLKALIVMFGWPEEKELENLEEELNGIDGVGSIEVIDIRRAIG